MAFGSRAILFGPALGLAAVLGACFGQGPPTSADTGGECTPGEAGCPCNDGVCLQGLECRDIGCVDPQCVEGTPDCPCLPAGGCDAGLSCLEGFCKPPPPGGSDSTGDGTRGSGGLTSSATGSTQGGVDEGEDEVTSSPMTMGVTGLTSDSGTPTECDPAAGMLCGPGDVCVEGKCLSAGPYGPCNDNCETDVCLQDMQSVSEVCSQTCTAAARCPPFVVGYQPDCIEDRCVIPCASGLDICPAPMQCALAGFQVEGSICVWPPPP